MSSEVNLTEIPQYGDAGSAFMGVEFNDTYLLIASILVGVAGVSRYGLFFFLISAGCGYMATIAYLDYKNNNLPGSYQSFLYKLGFKGYSAGHKSAKNIFHGDGLIINPGSDEQEAEMLKPYIESARNGTS